MKRKNSLKGFVIFLIALAIIFFIIFGSKSIFNFSYDLDNLLSSFFDRSFDYSAMESLERENAQLKAEIERLKGGNELDSRPDRRQALVYHRYPFSGKNSFVIDLGSEDNISEGMPVILEGFLVGSILNTSNYQSEVQTIFDSKWRSSVGIGTSSVKAVLEGGSTPQLTLIPDDADVSEGDSIFNLSPDFPIYQTIGSIGEVESESGEVWKRARLNVPYSINDVRKVEVIIDFP